jgi:hypothetical protein
MLEQDKAARHSKFEDAAEAVVFYLGEWWTAHGRVMQALLGDLILYVCLYGYLSLIGWLIGMFGLGMDYQQLLQYGILIADGAILLMFLRKAAITAWNQ